MLNHFFAATARSGLKFMALALLLGPAIQSIADDRSWEPIVKDGLRDPRSPAVKLLQPPADALRPLAYDYAGNQVRWVEAIRNKEISPRSSLQREVNTGTYDKDVFLNLNGGMPAVRFPHSVHNAWLDCSNCHDDLFRKERGATKISMFLILQGEQCGVCHGAVAFPLTECARCHSMKREDALAAVAAQDAEKAAEDAAKRAPAPGATPASAPRGSKP